MRASCVVRSASGITLVELIVVLAIVGLILGVSGLALASLEPSRESQDITAMRRARAEAIRTGVRTTHDARRTLFLPDGRAIGPGVNSLTGEPRAK